jgi:hypothetical protein
MNRSAACHRLPPPDGDIDIMRVELDAPPDPTGLLGRQQRRTAAEERVEHDALPARAVFQRIDHHREGFDGGMCL